jgi:hypothetical protein
MADSSRILAKIKKCLALAKSGNEHEAASALRQAQKMMQAHGVSIAEVENADIKEDRSRAGARLRPARWEAGLAKSAADAFACIALHESRWPSGAWVFIGIDSSAQIARYSFDVLRRQAKLARKAYIDSHLSRCAPATRTRLADLFCEGWVSMATALIKSFAGPPETKARLNNYVGEISTLKANNRNQGSTLGRADADALLAGARQGRQAQLNRGVGEADRNQQLEHSAA